MQPLLQQLTQFIINHWILCAAFVVILLAVIFEEIKDRLHAAPSLNSNELSMLLNHEEATVIDIRPTTVFYKEHILSALNIPLPANKNIDDLVKRLATKKEQHIVIVDSLGTDAAQVATKLYTAGLTKVSMLKGGMSSWKRDGLPTTTK